jgi:hypothetical protein
MRRQVRGRGSVPAVQIRHVRAPTDGSRPMRPPPPVPSHWIFLPSHGQSPPSFASSRARRKKRVGGGGGRGRSRILPRPRRLPPLERLAEVSAGSSSSTLALCCSILLRGIRLFERLFVRKIASLLLLFLSIWWLRKEPSITRYVVEVLFRVVVSLEEALAG